MPLDSDDIARLYGSHAHRLVAFFARRTFDPVAAGEIIHRDGRRVPLDGGCAR